ncbi:MAG: FAD-dependent oxidoreductase [Thermodesulfobacteriota bacterium]|nr:FAD-dependent oxidoreductase [Thermodesulfobacteriota bacterium]
MAEKNVLIIGGGAAGLAAARTLSKSGANAHIVEKSDFLGGHAIGYTCKAADTCLQCGACSVEMLLRDVTADPNIQVHRSAIVSKVEQKKGFTITLDKGPMFIDPEKCNNCGVCYEKAPAEGCVLRGYSQHNKPLYAINKDRIDECGPLADACPEGAINLNAKATSETFSVDAVIVASGFKAFDAGIKSTYGYGKFPNVISGLDMERIKREKGALLRPSDNTAAQKIAFIQCVGSRDEKLGNLWCSRVCCPYALRSAKSLKYKDPEADITVFYMDIQSFGKEFPVFYESCREDFRFVRMIPVDVFPTKDDKLSIRFFDDEGSAVADEGAAAEAAEADEAAETPGGPAAVYDTFDLLVLSVGITPNPDNAGLAELLGLDLDSDGFFTLSEELNATATAKAGVFVAGTAQQPKTIDASIAQADQAANEALKYLGE